MTMRRILLVDDEDSFTKLCKLVVEDVGDYEVRVVDNPAMALESALEFRPDVAVLDVIMPRMSGLQLAATFKENDQLAALPIIFLTGHADVQLAVRAMQSGAFDFLEKPFSDQDLLDRTHAALELDAGNRKALGQRRAIIERMAQLTPREREVAWRQARICRARSMSRSTTT